MTTRINTGKDEYIYCSISDNAFDHRDYYFSCEAALKQILVDVRQELEKKEATEYEMERNYMWVGSKKKEEND